MFDKLRQAHLHAHDWQQESLIFVPLRGTWFAQSEHSFDLEEEITKFLSGDKKVLLLLGDSGSGKSLYTQGLASKLWQDHKDNSPIPVWITLPSLKNPVNRVIEESFERFGFNAEQIGSLKQEKSFIFIFDAFDEIHQLKNLWVSNHLDQWKAKIIITCRREYLYHVDNYKHFFTPFNGEKALYLEYNEMIIKPFSEEQIEQYIKQCIQHQKSEWKLEQYQKAMEEIPGLKNLIKTPFLLKLAMEALPKMPQDKEQKYMTQAKLYDVFIEQWFVRQEQKLKLAKKIKEDEDIKPEFWDYAKRLAQLMHQQKITQVNYDSSQVSDLFGESEDNPWQKFFNPENPRIELLRTACLVREVGQHQYAFTHNSLLEYFLTRDLYENLLSKQQEVKAVKETPKSPQLEVKKQDYFNERLLVEEANTLQFLADRVDEDEGFKKILFDRVYASRRNPPVNISASNAITILNRARVSFSGMDLSEIQIPAADLTNGIFDYTIFEGADMREVRLNSSWLNYSKLIRANLKSVTMGEFPMMEFRDRDPVDCLTFSKDRRYMAIGVNTHVILYARSDDEYKILFHGEAHTGKVMSIAFNPDATQLVSGSRDTTLGLWDVRTGKLVTKLEGHKKAVTCVAFSPDGQRLASGSEDKTLQLWDIETKKSLWKVKRHLDGILCLEFRPDGLQIATGSQDETVGLWNAEDGKLIAKLQGPEEELVHWVHCVAFRHDSKQLASGGNGVVRIWDTDKGQFLTKLQGFNSWVESLAYSPDGKQLSTGGSNLDMKVGLWDTANYKLTAYLKGHTDSVRNLFYDTDGKQLISVGGSGKHVHFWDLQHQISQGEIVAHTSSVDHVCYSQNGKFFATASSDETIRIWDIRGACIAVLKGHTREVTSISISPDCNTIVSASRDRTMRLWDVATRKAIAVLDVKGQGCVAYSPDGRQFASGDENNTIRIWDAATRKCVTQLTTTTHPVRCITYSPDGKQLAAQSGYNIVQIWELDTQKLIVEVQLSAQNQHQHNLSYSPDGKYLARGEYKKVRILDALTGNTFYDLKGHEDSITCVAYNRNNNQLASGSKDQTIRIWDCVKRVTVVELKVPSWINSIAFSPDDKQLVSVVGDETIYIWAREIEAVDGIDRWMLIGRYANSFSLTAYGAQLNGAEIDDRTLTVLKKHSANVEQIGIQISDPYKLLLPQTIAFGASPINQSEVPLEVLDKAKKTPLIKAVIQGDVAQVELLLKHGAKINHDELHLAVICKQESVVEVLIKVGADCNKMDDNKETPLHYAAQQGLIKTTRLLLTKEVNIDAVDEDNLTPLHLAAMSGHSNIIELLLTRKPNLEIESTSGTAIVMAALEGHDEVLLLLLKAGANPNAALTDDTHLPLLFQMVTLNNHKIVKLLLEYNVDISVKSPMDQSILSLAAAESDLEMFTLLVHHHCPIDEPAGPNLWTPLYEAIGANNKPIIKYLLELGANPNFIEKIGGNAMHIAATVGDAEVVNLLIQFKVNLKQQTSSGWTALHAAENRGHIIQILANQDTLDLNAKTTKGYTAASLLALKGHIDSLKILLEHRNKLDLNLLTISGLTAIELAAMQGHKEIVSLLLKENINENYKQNAKKLLETNPLKQKNLKLFAVANYNEILETCNEILKIDVNDLLTLLQKSCAFMHLNRLQEALVCCDQVLVLDRYFENGMALRRKAVILFMLDNFADAKKYLEEVMTLSKDIFAMCYQGYIAILENNYDAAFTYFDDAIKIDAKSFPALFGKSLAADLLKQSEIANQCYQMIQTSNTELSVKLEFYCAHGKVLLKLGYFREASMVFERGLQLKTDHPVLIEARQGLLQKHKLQQNELSLNLFLRNIETDLVNGYLKLASDAANSDIKTSISYCERVIKLSPTTQTAHHHRACYCFALYLKERDSKFLNQAEESFQQALTLGKHSGICTEYANFLIVNKQFEKAIPVLLQAIELKSDGRTLSYGKAGRDTLPEEIQNELDAFGSLTLHASLLAYYLLGVCYKEIKQEDKYHRILEDYVYETTIVHKHDAINYSLLAYSEKRFNLIDEAISDFECAIEQNAKYELARKNLEACKKLKSDYLPKVEELKKLTNTASVETKSSFWSPPREQVSAQPPTPTKDTDSTFNINSNSNSNNRY